MTKQQAQFFLDNLPKGSRFNVIFTTQKGEQRQYTGFLIEGGKRSDIVAFETECDGIKSFDLKRVLSLELV